MNEEIKINIQKLQELADSLGSTKAYIHRLNRNIRSAKYLDSVTNQAEYNTIIKKTEALLSFFMKMQNSTLETIHEANNIINNIQAETSEAIYLNSKNF